MTRKMTTKNEQKNDQEDGQKNDQENGQKNDQENGQKNDQENGPRNQPPKAAGNGAPLRTRTRVNRRSDQHRRPERAKGESKGLSRFPLPSAPWPVRRGGRLIYGSAIRIPAKS
jgi:hypothetical protein